METVPNREKLLLKGKGTLLVSIPRNHTNGVETVAGREAGTWSGGVEVVPPSNVTIGVKSSLIREGLLLPPLVWRCLAGVEPLSGVTLCGCEVIEKQKTGRVA